MQTPLLRHFDPELETMLEADASDVITAGVLSQLHEDKEWHPGAFFSKSTSQAEFKYPVYDKEMLAIIRSLSN